MSTFKTWWKTVPIAGKIILLMCVGWILFIMGVAGFTLFIFIKFLFS